MRSNGSIIYVLDQGADPAFWTDYLREMRKLNKANGYNYVLNDCV